MLAREFEHSLDIKSAIKGQYVVKPQDLERVKALMYRNTHPLPSSSKAQDNVSSLPRIFHPEHLQGQTLSGQSSTYPLTSSTHNINTRAGLGLRLGLSPRPSKERRRSAGDETGLLQQSLNMFVRTRTDSGKPLSDMEILEQVTVLNLDTGERVPLSIAEDKLPQCINPLSLHIMRLTSEYVSNPTLEKEKESDEESVDSKMFVSIPDDTEDYQDTNSGRVRRKTAQLKRFLGSTVKKTMDKAKNIAHRHKEDVMDIVDEVNPQGEGIKLKASNSHKGPFDFESLQHVQVRWESKVPFNRL
ncbi:WD repeat-containing protein 44-like [Diaphorina citri]|uniref:WD repeat-containing protein 44-like n=1 Tax=Diaphorina citri TaxID=121845 RepID=A0A3Q0JIL8_DIACI|nr:WD repeat-containing protein 44-like [Diaphorina citri]